VGTRSHMCHGGWEVWVLGVSAIICMSKLTVGRSMVSYYVCCRKICTYTSTQWRNKNAFFLQIIVTFLFLI